MSTSKNIGKIALGLGASLLATEFSKKLVKEISETIIKRGVKEASDKVSEKTQDTINAKKEIGNKYENLRRVIISVDTDIESFKNAIFETSNMQKYYRYDLDSINTKNPANLPKHKLVSSKYEKWTTLLANLRHQAADRITKEATVVYESKNESDFFKPYPKINAELINCESDADFNEVLLKINKHYLKDFTTE